mgnify:CR=1 FL=1
MELWGTAISAGLSGIMGMLGADSSLNLTDGRKRPPVE